MLPNGDAGVMLIDCGANADCTPEYLLQFAYMGSYYARTMLGIAAPRVGLLSNGTEDHKGAELQHETFPLLKAADAAGRIRFIGNVEASQVFNGDVDVVVTDGFTGNVLLKGIEGSIKYMTRQLKGIFMKNFKTKMAALAIKDEFKALKASLDPNEVGGTAMLGISKPVIKAHGSSDARAIYNAIRQAISFVDSGIIDDITANISLYACGQARGKGAGLMEALEARLGYTFRDRSLLENALMHSSYANENRARGYTSNERLEFLGDSVLGMVTATRLYRLYPDMPEGKMSRLRAELVCEQALHGVACALHLGDYIRLGHGEERSGGRERPSILADAVEAVIAAMYLDGGLEPAQRFILAHILNGLAEGEIHHVADYKTELQERVQRRAGQTLSLYRLRRERSGSQQDVHHGRAAQWQRDRPRHRAHQKRRRSSPPPAARSKR